MEENLREAYKLEWWHRGLYFLNSIQIHMHRIYIHSLHAWYFHNNKQIQIEIRRKRQKKQDLG